MDKKINNLIPQLSIINRINELPAIKKFGVNVDFNKEGLAVVSIDPVNDLHTGGMESNAINGMTLMGMLDVSMCAASLLRVGSGVRCATLEMSVKFIKPVLGVNFMATGRVISSANNLLFCEANIVDSRGRLRATASGLIQQLR